MNLRQSFNLMCSLQLDRVKAFGYDRAVSFTPRLGTAPLIQRTSAPESLGKERTAPSSKYHPQVHRANRNVERAAKYSIFGLDDDELSPEQLKKRKANQAYHARKKAAKAQLVMVWPEQES